MTITGSVVYVTLEGGFFGIRGDDGMNYLPDPELPAEFRKEGTRIRAEAEYSEGMSVFMWGTMIRISKINKN